MSKLNITFYGSSNLSLIILEKLFEFHKDQKINLIYVVTQPAKPFSRKKELKNNDVFEFCLQNGIKVFTPNRISELKTEKIESDVALVAAYGKILPKWLLDTAKFGFINFHGSILPKYRGAAPVQFTILDQNLDSAGISVIKMDEGMDTGGIIMNYELGITKEEFEILTSGELMEKLGNLCSEKLEVDFEYFFNPENWKFTNQDESQATYCHVSDMAKVNFEILYADGIELTHGKIMAANPDPKAFLMLSDGITINILRSKKTIIDFEEKKGYLNFKNNSGSLFLELNDGFLEILEIQVVGKNVIDAESFINGYKTKYF